MGTKGSETAMIHKEVLKIEDVARYLRLGRRSVYRMVQRGEIPGRKILGRWRFHILDIEDWLRGRNEPERVPGAVTGVPAVVRQIGRNEGKMGEPA